MKLNPVIIFTILMFLVNTNTLVCTTTALQQPPTERQFNANFKDRYSGRKYNYEGTEVVSPTSPTKGTPSKYSDKKPDLKDENNVSNFSYNFNGLNWLFVVILIIAVVFLAYTLLNDGGSKLFSSKSNKKIQTYDDINSKNIAQVDIKTLITNAENANDYRLAIRYYYLLVLKELAQKNFIIYEDDKTNADYMQAIATQKFNKDFAYTSYLYNYTWYGEFDLSPMQYQTAKTRFVELIKKVNT